MNPPFGHRASQRLLALAAAFGLAVSSMMGVVVTADPAESHTTDPGAGWAWDHVGLVNGGVSGVYLGNYNGGNWVMTATHIGTGQTFTLNGVTYAAEAGSSQVVRNSSGASTDLMLFKLTSAPNLSRLEISCSAPDPGANLIYAGYGWVAQGDKTYWDVNNGVWTETADPLLADQAGYHLQPSGGTLTWGRATLAGYINYSVGTGITKGFYTRFVDLPGYAQGAGGDSGSPVFVETLTGWKLAGIASAISGFAGQPGGTAVFGNYTVVGSLANYSGGLTDILGDLTAISAPIPEPGSIVAYAGCIALVAAYLSRRLA